MVVYIYNGMWNRRLSVACYMFFKGSSLKSILSSKLLLLKLSPQYINYISITYHRSRHPHRIQMFLKRQERCSDHLHSTQMPLLARLHVKWQQYYFFFYQIFSNFYFYHLTTPNKILVSSRTYHQAHY